jgi:hypothetical protein
LLTSEPISRSGNHRRTLTSVDASFALQAAAAADVRQQGLARLLRDDDLMRLFGMGVALEQMHRNLRDLADRGVQLARASPINT